MIEPLWEIEVRGCEDIFADMQDLLDARPGGGGAAREFVSCH